MSTNAAGTSTIQGTISVQTLFERRFVIPAYQRVFDWGYREINDLLSDLYGHATSSMVDPDDLHEYLLNSILTLDTGSELELIDGQQRLTALTLLFAAARDIAKQCSLLNDSYIQTLDGCVSVKDGDKVSPRLRDQYPNGPAQDFLNQIACGIPSKVERDSPAYPLYRGYVQIQDWLTKSFPPQAGGETQVNASLARFLDVVRKRARFAEIRVSSSAVAWRTFERANDRGKPLSVADRVKSDLFNMTTNNDDRAAVAKQWRSMLDSLRRCQTSPDVFLHHAALADYAEAKVTRTGVRSVFRDHLERNKDSAPDLAQKLATAAKAYGCILTSIVPLSGIVSVPLVDLSQVPRLRRVVQARPALLAARHLNSRIFDEIAAEIERFIVVVVLTEQRGQDYEKEMFDIAKMLRAGNANSATILDDVRARVSSRLTPRADALAKILSQATKDSLGHEMSQYLLSKAEMSIRSIANPGTARLPMSTLVGGVNHIEHILPQSLPAPALSEFGLRTDAERLVQALGNLTIWEGSQNSAMQDAPYSTKQSEYSVSDFKITKSLVVSLGSTGGNRNAACKLSSATEWNVDTLERRHQELGAVIMEALLGSSVPAACAVVPNPEPPVQLPTFPSPTHLTRVLAGVNKGLRTPTDLISVVDGVSTVGVINQALGALEYLGLVIRQEGSWDLTEVGQVVCSEDNTKMVAEVAGLIVVDPTLQRCTEAVASGAPRKGKRQRAANAVRWAQEVLTPCEIQLPMESISDQRKPSAL